jgi:hypothetical protein
MSHPSLRFITIESSWTPKECPLCRRTATSHAWLFDEPPPRAPQRDRRDIIGDVFIHDKSDDCAVRAHTRKRLKNRPREYLIRVTHLQYTWHKIQR